MPRLVQRRADPEAFELIGSLCVTIAMATAAGLTGGTSSPLVFLLPIGVVLNGLRAGRDSILICSGVTAAVFVFVSLLEEGAAIVHEPLPMIAILAMQPGSRSPRSPSPRPRSATAAPRSSTRSPAC